MRLHPDGASTIETLSTDEIPAAKRIEFWNEVVCSSFTALTVDALSDRFTARMRRLDLGDVRLAVAESTQATVMHSRAQASHSPDAFFLLHLQLVGDSVNQQNGRDVLLSPGDLTLIDSTQSYRIAFSGPTSILVVRIPRALLRKYVACPETLAMLALPGSSGTCRLAARFIRDMWKRSQQVTAEGSEGHLTDALMSVIAAACATVPRASIQGSAHAAVLRIRLIECIEARLGDPDLNPAAIAQEGGISLRYLHLLFGEQGESVWRYVQRRRVEESARVLRDPLRARSSVTEIACEHGFKSAAHFCRAFRERYSVSPSDFRLAMVVESPHR
jgi:AraC family transcriptional activator of tynA and feaB